MIKPDGSNVVDVRSEGEFMMGHVAGSVNIPLNTVPEQIDRLRSMGEPLILCCASGNRSGQAQRYLESEGLTGVHNGGGWLQVQGAMA